MFEEDGFEGERFDADEDLFDDFGEEAPEVVASDAPRLHFCPECQNMMQPKEDRLASKLVFICARCGITKDASNPCVYQNKLVTEAQNQLATVKEHCVLDPALSRTRETECPRCHANEAVFFQSHDVGGAAGMALIFVCCSCKHKWVG